MPSIGSGSQVRESLKEVRGKVALEDSLAETRVSQTAPLLQCCRDPEMQAEC